MRYQTTITITADVEPLGTMSAQDLFDQEIGQVVAHGVRLYAPYGATATVGETVEVMTLVEVAEAPAEVPAEATTV